MDPKIPKIVSLSPLPQGALEMFMAPHLGGTKVELVSLLEKSPQEIKEAIRSADILLGDFTFVNTINAETIADAPRLRLIQQPSVGYQHIDLEACRQKNIPVANAAGANSLSVAEHTLMLALVLLKQTLYFHNKTAQAVWAQMEAFERGVFELASKRWGIFGMGRIGWELAKRLRAFDVEIFYSDKKRLETTEEEKLNLRFVPFEKLIRQCDIISLHVPLSAETRQILNADKIRQMKTGSYLINVARGELVDEIALAEALNSKRIAGAGLDVFSEEPVKPNNPLLKCKNVVLTPHLAGTTNEARARIIEVSAKNILRVLRGEQPINVL